MAQGTDILLDESAGMDVLGHELAHAVQQAQGRVEGGFPVVENAALEHEADVMGARVASGLTAQAAPQNGFGGEAMTIAPMSSASAPAQCKAGKTRKRERGRRAPAGGPGPEKAGPALPVVPPQLLTGTGRKKIPALGAGISGRTGRGPVAAAGQRQARAELRPPGPGGARSRQADQCTGHGGSTGAVRPVSTLSSWSIR